MTTPPKLCECGCGEATTVPKYDNKRYGQKAGVPLRFVHGHNRRTSPVDYVEDPATGCWLWQRSVVWSGYGIAWRNGTNVLAHRWYYEQAKGPIPDGYQLDHLCRTRACVNPDHLEAVTRRENMRRGANAILTAEQVMEIRAYKPGARIYDRAFLARHFGVSEGTISEIRCGRTWQDVGVAT